MSRTKKRSRGSETRSRGAAVTSKGRADGVHEAASTYLTPRDLIGDRPGETAREFQFLTSLSDISDLLVRRVQERVEERILRRYTRIGMIVALLGSGGGYLVLDKASDNSSAGSGTSLAGNDAGVVAVELSRRQLAALDALAEVDSTLVRIEKAERALERIESGLGRVGEAESGIPSPQAARGTPRKTDVEEGWQ